MGGCGDTIQDQPIPHNVLEGMLLSPFPVYWLGGSFGGLAITEAVRDPGGAFSVRYGDCLEGGQGACVRPLLVTTSPDNSFVPGGSSHGRKAQIRGVPAVLAQGGATIEIPTGPVLVEINAQDARRARAAARTIVPINAIGAPGSPLPPRLPDTGYAAKPLPAQVPPPLRFLEGASKEPHPAGRASARGAG
jgi:hypothetical protein